MAALLGSAALLLGAGVLPAAAAPAGATTMAAAGAASAAAGTAAAAPAAGRLSGRSAAGLAVAASRRAFPAGADLVVVADGTNYQQTVAAGATAARLGGALLLVSPTSLSGTVRSELVRLDPERILVAGGPRDVSDAVIARLAAVQPDVTRITGASAYSVAQGLARLGGTGASDSIVIAAGAEHPILLSAGAMSGATGAPLILLRSSDRGLTSTTAAMIDSLAVETATVVGPTSQIPASAVRALRGLGLEVERIDAGSTAATISEVARRSGPSSELLVAAEGGVRIAAGAVALAGLANAPIVLSTPYCATKTVRVRADRSGARRITVLGTPGVIRGLVGSLEACRSIRDASSSWLLVNKRNRLSPASYVPSGLRVPSIASNGGQRLRSGAATALERLVASAKAQGAGRIGLASGYRSYATQKALYARYVRERGQAWADSQSARAGHSEHQTGLAADLVACGSGGCGSIYGFGGTAQGRWVAKNAWRHGFIVRYEAGRISTTGYTAEPWHLRYVGPELAADYRAGGFHTLEDYLGAKRAPRY
ncbi:D-alanyl-D-alanine carboxypeptidase family protein [Homoserinibacter sp. YIM 151385]|uniref:D-alanyl-D-alanine carboxypeptidase family protein n=1 Tax=Homoserinibacter sp. YIM 151385 TaxID=2985506 RepID=UPI0022F0EF2D|nr:D-alanyl-D-alanine carboxypeptidase family protein [Homoserinibacter sp. YIM 151385]WBU39025.1 D-alanyl-D-alanine carboxypeptidase family protein [Homoserinibacter sp. YIM 151385]